MNEKHFGMRYTDSLAHHGILGQRWGIRRYQNPDGSLTPEGKLRYMKRWLNSKKHMSPYDKISIRKKIKPVKRGIFKDHLKSGTEIVRYSDKPIEKDVNRTKYVSANKDDIDFYKDSAVNNLLRLKKNGPIYKHTYKLTKNVKVVRPERVLKDIIDLYGDDDTKKSYETFNKLKLWDRTHTFSKFYNMPNNAIMTNWTLDAVRPLKKGVRDIMLDKEKVKTLINKYKREGYSAMGDPEDYTYGVNYPMIMLDPANTMKITSTKKIKRVADNWGNVVGIEQK